MGNKRHDTAEKTASGGLLGNAALALIKALVGGTSGSAALLADAVRSATEAALSSAALLGLRRRSRSASAGRMPGLRKAELAASLIVTVVLLVVGLELAISSFRLMVNGVDHAPHWSALAVATGALFVKWWVLRIREGRLELLASLLTLLGIGASLTGELAGIPLLYYLDPAAGFLVALIVIVCGYRLIAGEVAPVLGGEAHQEDTQEFMQFIQRIEGVITIEELNAREHGHYVRLEMRISVNPRISVFEGQEIAKRVKELVMKRFIHISEVAVSVDPYDPGYPYKSNYDPNQEHVPTLLQ
ncbi:cation diffusion facilitator family transporter [Paenibacillus sp. GCM10012307]|uniref:Cation diffusion facilitator family transporter n=1 Tax=Paenibacillus roseus TaxID=2798579 RepID=A0A934J9U1_9BACL|nr:cation diffusion facilitator family transporter [Paenibacillus roseus]MBJ6362960.1 cation diffusion facilitator family transporter [Paenibacillus roseus]